MGRKPMDGSSPRGRGTPSFPSSYRNQSRFIPARAGNTGRRHMWPCHVPVHPRAGGEHTVHIFIGYLVLGSSPRGRGTHSPHFHRVLGTRFIPARAGNTGDAHRGCRELSVHPRAGGEHRTDEATGLPTVGSSPRGRGTLGQQPARTGAERFIPARAGNTSKKSDLEILNSVHPRAGGEHKYHHAIMAFAIGSSPRGRGTLIQISINLSMDRFIPARAGNTFRIRWRDPLRSVHPRAGGEHPLHRGERAMACGSSPRGRGTQSL